MSSRDPRPAGETCPSLLLLLLHFPPLLQSILPLFSHFRIFKSLPNMSYHASVMYPNDDDITFDESYYLKTHMPLVESIWKKYGLVSWKIIKYTTALDGSPSKYLIAANLEWKSEEDIKSALQDPESAKIFADIPNFTNKQPITLGGPALA